MRTSRGSLPPPLLSSLQHSEKVTQKVDVNVNVIYNMQHNRLNPFKMTQQYSISDLASEFDITTRSIRFYEEKGLLRPIRRGQTRVYSSADRTKLKLILRGKRLGLSLEESRDIIEMYAPQRDNSPQLQRLIDKIREKRQQLEQQLNDIQTLLQELDAAETRCLDALDNASPDQSITAKEP